MGVEMGARRCGTFDASSCLVVMRWDTMDAPKHRPLGMAG